MNREQETGNRKQSFIFKALRRFF